MALLKERYDKALKVIDKALADPDMEVALPAAKFVAGYVLGKPSVDSGKVDSFTINFNKLVIGAQHNAETISRFIPKMIEEEEDALSH